MLALRVPVRGPVVAHLALMAVCGVVADVTTPGTLWVGAFAYALLQGGRVLHELAHAWTAERAGLAPRAVRLGVVSMAVDFGQHGIWSAAPGARRATALAGALVEALFGASLVLVALLHPPSHASEPVLLIGVVHLAGVSNLWPVSGSDGEYVFGRAWRPRAAWLPLAPVLAIQTLAPLAATVVAFPRGGVATYAATLHAPSELLYIALAFGLALALSPRIINAANGADSRAYTSRVVRGVR